MHKVVIPQRRKVLTRSYLKNHPKIIPLNRRKCGIITLAGGDYPPPLTGLDDIEGKGNLDRIAFGKEEIEPSRIDISAER
jgi:hypothetical protein